MTSSGAAASPRSPCGPQPNRRRAADRRRAGARQRSCRRRPPPSRQLEPTAAQAAAQSQAANPPSLRRPWRARRRIRWPPGRSTRAISATAGRPSSWATRSKMVVGEGEGARRARLKATRPSGSSPTRAVAPRTASAERSTPRTRAAGTRGRGRALPSPSPHSISSTRSGSRDACRTAAASGVIGAGPARDLDRKRRSSRVPRRWRSSRTAAGSSSPSSPCRGRRRRGDPDRPRRRRRRGLDHRRERRRGLRAGRGAGAEEGQLQGAEADGGAGERATAVVRDQLRHLRDRARHRARAEDRQLLRLPLRRRLLRRPHLPPDRPRLRDPGRRPARHGTGGPGYSVDEKPPANLAYTKGVGRDGEELGRAARALRQPVLRGHRRRRRPAARIRAGRQGQRGLRRGRPDRQARDARPKNRNRPS